MQLELYLNTNRYIKTIIVCCTTRRSRQHNTKNKDQRVCPKKDKPPSRPLNRVARFTRDLSKGEFGFFHYLLYVELPMFKISSVGCRSPPNQLF